MKKGFMIVFLVFSSMAFANCPIDLTAADLCADLAWIEGPYDGKTSQFRVKFWKSGDEDQVAKSPQYKLDIYSWMVMGNGHNHGGPKLTWSEVSPGVFEVLDARFFMGQMQGHWLVRIDLLDNQNQIAAESSYRVVLP